MGEAGRDSAVYFRAAFSSLILICFIFERFFLPVCMGEGRVGKVCFFRLEDHGLFDPWAAQ